MKWLGLGTLGAVAILFGAWWSFVRAPAPAEVCDHIIDVTVSEARDSGMSVEAEASLIEGLRARCIAHKRDKIQLRGRIKYARYAKCVLSQETVASIDRC